MQINELKLAARKKRKTIGRGGKRGTYSGKGNKGQWARSGASIDPLFEGGRSSLIERLKKVKGFKSIRPRKNTVKLSQLAKFFKAGEIVSGAALVEKKLVEQKLAKNGVKILFDQEVKVKLTIAKEILLSKTAEAAIIKAGGEIAK